MTNFSTKIRLIYIPFLIVALSFIFIYTFLNWLFVIRLETPLSEDMVDFWLPFSLPWIPILIWLRPRIKLLILKDKKGNLPFLYQFIAAGAIIAPTIIAQEYLTTAAGKLTVSQNIDKITAPLTKYYELKQYFIDKQHIAVYQRTAVSGRSNEDLSFYIDVACPILTESLKPDSAIHFKTGNGKKPLIVIDGKPASSDTALAHINPADVANVYIIKGRQATALYGSAARQGAILITTKNIISTNTNFLQGHIPKAWLCLEFSKNLSNHLSDEKKEAEFKEFDSISNAEFKEKKLNEFVYLDRIAVNDRRKGYINAIKSKINNVSKPLIFEAVNQPFEDRNGNKFVWIFRSFGIGAAIWLLIIIIPKLDSSKIQEVSESTLKSEWSAFYKSLSFVKLYKVTCIVIGLNLLVFIVMVFAGLGFISFEGRDLLNWGADYRPATINGQWWRLVTSIFLHGGLMHLLLNMYGLFFVGIFLEPLLGRLKYAAAYLICGIAASITSIWWHPATVSIGASGAIFGLYGVLTALLTTNRADFKSKKSLLLFSLFFIVINLVMGLAGGIDNAAHIGGLICGLLLGYIFYFFTDMPEEKDESENKEVTSNG